MSINEANKISKNKKKMKDDEQREERILKTKNSSDEVV